MNRPAPRPRFTIRSFMLVIALLATLNALLTWHLHTLQSRLTLPPERLGDMARDLFLVANGLLLVWFALDFLLLWWGNIRRHRRGEQPRPPRSLLDWVKILATGIAIAAINTYSRSIVEILRSPQARSIAIASLIAFSLLFTITPILFVIKVSREERHRKMAASSVKARFGASTHTEPLEVESRSAQN